MSTYNSNHSGIVGIAFGFPKGSQQRTSRGRKEAPEKLQYDGSTDVPVAMPPVDAQAAGLSQQKVKQRRLPALQSVKTHRPPGPW